jgi:hypothetical protein
VGERPRRSVRGRHPQAAAQADAAGLLAQFNFARLDAVWPLLGRPRDPRAIHRFDGSVSSVGEIVVALVGRDGCEQASGSPGRLSDTQKWG